MTTASTARNGGVGTHDAVGQHAKRGRVRLRNLLWFWPL